MVLNQLYRFIAIAVLGIVGCTASGSPGQLTQSCSNACAQYSGNDTLSQLCQLACQGSYDDSGTCCDYCTNQICYTQGCPNSSDSGFGPTCSDMFNACNAGCLNNVNTSETCSRTSCS